MATSIISTAVPRRPTDAPRQRRVAHRRRLLPLACALAVCAGYAGLAVGNGLDRAAERKPALAALVPGPFAARALPGIAEAQLSQGRPQAALITARRAILADPVEPANTALLGGAQLALGEDANADRAFRVAGQFGWRYPLTQLYWLRQALALEDYRVAALRLDALLRQDPALLQQGDVVASIEAKPEGRAALVERMAQGPEWLAPYAHDTWDIPAPVAISRAHVLDDLAARGHPLGCARARALTARLVATGQAAEADRFWKAHCAVPRQGLLSDPNFAGLEIHVTDSPFEWMVIGDSDVSVNLETAPAGNRVALASSASFPRRVLTQLVPLVPGSYQLTWHVQTDQGPTADRIAAALDCPQGAHQTLVSHPAGGDRWAANFTVDAACPARWLSLWIVPGQASIYLSRVDLQPQR